MTQIPGLSADQIIAQFQSLIADEIDQTSALFLLNEVKDTIEAERQWNILNGLNTSNSVPSGVAWKTPIALPSDFSTPSPRGIYIANDLIPYRQITFGGQIDFQSITYAYFLDLFNFNYYLCGTPTVGATINFFYGRSSPQMALVVNGGQPWIFPARFHPLLVYEMAIKYFAMDQGDKGRSWDDRWTTYAQRIREAMWGWDDQTQSLALQNEPDFAINVGAQPNIIDMDAGSPGGIQIG